LAKTISSKRKIAVRSQGSHFAYILMLKHKRKAESILVNKGLSRKKVSPKRIDIPVEYEGFEFMLMPQSGTYG
jgi:hypothetical protein